MLIFEFNEVKSDLSLRKHGINYQTATRLWEDFHLLEIRARSEDEPRFLVIGRLDGKHWSAVITYRNQRIRLISARRSRKLEMELYESRRI
ncbi:MAG: BrnT family toxin [SAR324 cluster bacterium]|nr:BrnT family toxin [SAR324 cluster bacterium]MEC8595800.1 BrnT family toxin [SAR324 cluster bacterium]